MFIPVFPGTNCEYDLISAFEKAGAVTDVFVMKNLTSAEIKESVQVMKEKILNSQIIMVPGGFSASDRLEGSGKFITAVLGKPVLADAIMEFIKNRDGLMLGISGGFMHCLNLGYCLTGNS